MAGVRVTARGLGKASADMEAITKRMKDLSPAMKVVGQMIRTHIDDRFKREEGPTGANWVLHSDVTLMMRQTRTKGGRKALASTKRAEAKGKMTKTRARVNKSFLSAKLLQDRGRLRNSVFVKPKKRSVAFGANAKYAAVQHFGNPDNRLPNTSGGNPAPIPARPFVPATVRNGKATTIEAGDAKRLWERARSTIRNYVLNGVARPEKTSGAAAKR